MCGRAQDADYFGPLAAATADPAQLGAFLHHLQNVDLTGFNIRRAPYTKALGDQKTESFKPEERWLLDGLMRGHMSPLTEVVIGGHARWPEWYTTAALFDAYKRWCDEHHRMLYSRNRVHFGRFMAKFYPPYREQRQTGYRFGPLAEARERFEAVTGTAGAIVWEDERDNITPFPSGKYGDHRRG